MKNILFVGLRYHSYTEEIISELRRQGNKVTYHDIQPRDLLMKTLRVTATSVYHRRLSKHHTDILTAESGSHYDLVLFIQVHQMAVNTLEAFRNEFKSAEFVLYNWDAITNHDYRPYIHLFDRVYTFDPQDALALDIQYLPLFCIPAFHSLKKREQQRKAIYFVGNIVSVQRYRALQAFKRYCQQEGIEFNSYMACTPYVLTLLLRAGCWPTDISIGSIDHDRFIDMIETSVAVFDYANHKQSGYTMRTMENLCAGKKIITSNVEILNAPFYSEDRILVFQGLDFSGIKKFLETPLQLPNDSFPDYHINTFVKKLIVHSWSAS
jgi:hypothetical protein